MNSADINLKLILEGCRRGNRSSQHKLYEHFHGYALSICLRYSSNREEAVEVMNDAFFKALTRLDQYDPMQPFKPWLRRILIHSAIDYFRKNHKQPAFVELAVMHDKASEEMPLPEISPDEDLLPLLRKLSPAYRTVFNLYVMEGFKHDEIAEILNISVSASRSNLARAAENLRSMLAGKNTVNAAKSN